VIKTLLSALILTAAGAATMAQAPAQLRVSHSHLVVNCFNGKPIDGDRRWQVSAPVSLTLTMRNQPRPGIDNAAPGIAVIDFVPEPGHKYEVEVRGDAGMFSRRVWPQGEWTAVVRDRTAERIVSSTPRWIDAGCGAPAAR